MERLTGKRESGAWPKKGWTDEGIAECFDRLAAYEETGLEPEEVAAFDRLATLYVEAGLDKNFVLACIEATKAGMTISRLRELAQADREGRCVVFQPGYAVVSIYNPADEDGLHTMSATGVITKEEYAAALRREQG